MILKEYISSNFRQILLDQSRYAGRDEEMISCISNRTLSVPIVKSWMEHYNLMQGINGLTRVSLAEEFIAFTNQKKLISDLDIESLFSDLHKRLYRVSNRKWLSATSKLLWCIYPDQVVIYDSFVERAIAVLQCIDPGIAKLPRLGYPPKGGEELSHDNITHYYLKYVKLVKAIYLQYDKQINYLNLKHEYGFKYPIRCIDKVLWSIGNMDHEFNLGDIQCRLDK